jgi:hypothetical protein
MFRREAGPLLWRKSQNAWRRDTPRHLEDGSSGRGLGSPGENVEARLRFGGALRGLLERDTAEHGGFRRSKHAKASSQFPALATDLNRNSLPVVEAALYRKLATGPSSARGAKKVMHEVPGSLAMKLLECRNPQYDLRACATK